MRQIDIDYKLDSPKLADQNYYIQMQLIEQNKNNINLTG